MNDPESSPRPEAKPRHPIAIVTRRTGLSANLLRAWERRYGAITPGRTATGRRLYSDEDIARLGLMRQALAGGHRIGEVAGLSLARLEALVREERQAGDVGTGAAKGDAAGAAAATGGAEALLSECLRAVEELDRDRLEAVLAEGGVQLGRQALRAEIIVPLMAEIGRRWQDGQLRIVHEHLASAVVRAFLIRPAHGQPRAPAGPRLVVTTPSGQLHEFGALLAAAAAADHGWDVVYLGPDLPAEEIAAAVRRLRAPAVALSLVYPLNGARLHEQLHELRRAVGPAVTILVGGRAAAASRQTLLEIEAIAVEDASLLPAVLDDLDLAEN